MKNTKKTPSRFAPIFIASTAVFFLGSAYRFIVGGSKEKNKSSSSDLYEQIQVEETDDELEEVDDENPKEPEEDPVKSL